MEPGGPSSVERVVAQMVEHVKDSQGGHQCPLGAAKEASRGIGVSELHRVDELTGWAVPRLELLLVHADDAVDRVKHQVLADQSARVSKTLRALVIRHKKDAGCPDAIAREDDRV